MPHLHGPASKCEAWGDYPSCPTQGMNLLKTAIICELITVFKYRSKSSKRFLYNNIMLTRIAFLIWRERFGEMSQLWVHHGNIVHIGISPVPCVAKRKQIDNHWSRIGLFNSREKKLVRFLEPCNCIYGTSKVLNLGMML